MRKKRKTRKKKLWNVKNVAGLTLLILSFVTNVDPHYRRFVQVVATKIQLMQRFVMNVEQELKR
jgi:hypothetical protein